MKFNLWRTSARFSQAIQLRNKVVLLFLSLLFFGTGSLTWLTSTNAFSNLARLIFVPAITSISPATPTASSLDQNVTVFGSGFQSGLTVTVTFPGGGTGTLSDSQIQSVTSTSFVMVVTLNATGTWSIRANNPSGGGSSNTFSFNVQAVSPPSISSISPSSPTVSGSNQNVTVFGSNFQSGLTVSVTFPGGGGTTLSGSQIQSVTLSSFVMVVTLNTTGNWGIRVNNPNGLQSNLFNFTVQPAQPTITGISPPNPEMSSSNQGIFVFGTNFQPNLTITVTFPNGGGTTLSGSQISYTNSFQVVMIITLNSAGTWSIRVNNPDGGQSNIFNFNVQAGLNITSISPASPTASSNNQNVTVNGSGFQTGLTVSVTFPGGGGTTLSGTQIQNVTSTSFVMVITLNSTGTWSIRINNPNGSQSNTFSFTVQSPPTNKTLVWTGSGTVYWFQNGKLYGITSQSHIDTQRNAGVTGWSAVNTFGSLSYPLAPLFVSLTDNNSNGLLLKVYGSNPAVYLVQNRQKRVLSLDEFNQSGYSFSDVIEVAQGILNLFPDAPSPTPVPTLSQILPQTTPVPGVRFYARIEGGNFTPNAVEIVVLGPGCPYIGACVVPNSVLTPGGISSTVINSAPFTLADGTFEIYARNGSNGTLSIVKPLTINPAVPTPTIDTLSFSATPLVSQPFTANLKGSGFDPATVRVEITGPSCSPCIRDNNTLTINATQISVALQLNNAGAFQITARNGSNGTPAQPKTLVVTQQPPSTFTLAGKIGIWDEQTKKLWQMNGADVNVTVKLISSGQTIQTQQRRTGTYEFNNLPTGTYDLRVTVEYKEEGRGTVKPPLTKWAHKLRKGIVLNHSTDTEDIRFPPVIALVHGILSDYEKWYFPTSNETQDISEVNSYWDQHLRRIGTGSATEPQGFITITPDYRSNSVPYPANTDIGLFPGGWEEAVTRIGLQIGATMQNLTTGVNDQAWPPFYYIGHSQGGLIGRALLSGRNKEFAISRAARYMYQLGSPNSGGTPLGLNTNRVPSNQPYSYLSEDEMMKDFNRKYRDFGLLPKSKVIAFAGNCPKVLGNCSTTTDLGGTDGVVPILSVRQIKVKECKSKCEPQTLHTFPVTNFGIFPYKHTELGSSASLELILKGRIIPHLAGLSGISNSFAVNAAINLLAETQQQLVTTEVLPRRVHATSVSLSANQAQTVNFNVSSTDLLIVNAFAGTGIASVSLISPNGQTINLNSAGQVSGAIYEDELGTWFVLDNPVPGQWMAQLQATTPSIRVSLSVQERSKVGFEGYVKDDGILLNQQARLQANWVGDMSSINSPSITASIFGVNGNLTQTINLFDDGTHDDGAAGDGVFGAVTSNLSTAGRYIVAFRAQGNYQGFTFTREAADPVDVLPASHLFTGAFTHSEIDSNADGIPDTIRTLTGVSLLANGNYLVSADLYDARGYFIGNAITSLEASSSGYYSPALDFNVSQANCEQFSQAFSIRNITLTDAASFRVWDKWTAQVNTQVFSGLAFNCVTVPTGLQITAIQPNTIVKGDTAQVQISGKSFSGGATLSLGSGVVITSLTPVSNDLLIAQITTDANTTAGVRDVAVANPDGRGVTATGLFSVTTDQPPTVAISNLANQQNLNGTVTVSASAADDKGVQKVEFYLDGTLTVTDTTFPYQFVWNTTTTSNGSHTVLAKAYDTANQSGTAQVTVITGVSGLLINNVTPLAGRASGGQQIKLTGSFANLLSVTMGGVSAAWTYASGTNEITVTTPSHDIWAVDIVLTPTSGSTYTKTNAFAYLPTTFTDNVLVAGVTTPKAQHIIELRNAIDSLRLVAGLALAPWTDATLSPNSTAIKAVHITELRTYLEQVAALLGYAAGSYTDPGLGSGFVIKRVHIEELRQRIRTIAG